MDELFPSEIARLVLGYLKECKCEKSWKIFLEESSNLHEYCELYKRGKRYPTNVNGKSLLNILNEYSSLKRDAENNCSNEFSASAFKEKCKMILEEIVTNATEHVLLKYFPSICGKNHRKDTATVDVTEIIHTTELSAKNCIDNGNNAEKGTESAHDDHTPENDSHMDSNIELNITDCNTNQSCEQSGSRENAADHCIVESSVSDSIYLQEIIKVEKDDSFSVLENSPENISDVRSQAAKQNEVPINISEWYENLNSTIKNSKVLRETSDASFGNNKIADKTIESKQITDSMDVEIVKLEPYSEVNSNQNNISNTNCFQNSSIIASQDSSLVEISQTALCDTQGTIGQFSNLVNNISFSTNQSGYAVQTTPFPNQPVAVNDLSFPSVPTYIVPNYSSNTPYMQNNAQYSFVINAPTPWKETVGGFSLNLPSIHSNNIGPVLTSIESITNTSTPSVQTVCVNNELNPGLTAVNPVIGNTSSATGVSVNTISNPALTTVHTAAAEQSLTVSSVPSNASSFVNIPVTVQSIPKSNLVTSDSGKHKSTGKLKNKHTTEKKRGRKKSKKSSLEGKETNNDLEIQTSGKDVCNKSKRKFPEMLPSSALEKGKKTEKNKIKNNADSQLQSKAVQPKMKTRRKGKY